MRGSRRSRWCPPEKRDIWTQTQMMSEEQQVMVEAITGVAWGPPGAAATLPWSLGGSTALHTLDLPSRP